MNRRIALYLLALLLGSVFLVGLDRTAAAQEADAPEEVPIPIEQLVKTMVSPYLRHYEYGAVSQEVAGRGAEAVEPLVEHLASSSVSTQLQLLGTLSRIGPDIEPALPDLLILLRDRNPLLSAAAAKCIGVLGEAGQEALPDLFLALERRDEITVAEAARAIAAIDPQFVPRRFNELLLSLDTDPENVRLLPLRTWYRIARRKVDDPAMRQDLRQWTLVVHFASLDRVTVANLLGLR